MPQQFQVLRCCNCEKFQVRQTNKAKKWDCKVCGEKQSYIKIFFTGSARECRSIVQQSNMLEGERKVSQMLAETCNDTEENNVCFSQESVDCSDEEQFFPTEPSPKKFKAETEEDLLEDNFHSTSSYFPLLDEYGFEAPPSQGPLIENVPMTSYTQTDGGRVLKECPPNQILKDNIPENKLHPDSPMKPKSLRTIPPLVKNRGFQKILEAAGRLK